MKDELGERMKEQYEHRTRYFVPRRTYSIIRLDGKAFHTYTKGLVKPFDKDLSEDMDKAIIKMLPHIQGAVFAYTQSDEISVLVTDFNTVQTSAWFDGNIQKIASVSASIITAEFNRARLIRKMSSEDPVGAVLITPHAYFDSRLFTIPDREEVGNYFIWRNQDCTRNSVSMVAQSVFSHKELQGRSTMAMRSMLLDNKTPWESYSSRDRFGRIIVKDNYLIESKQGVIPINGTSGDTSTFRTHWVSKEAWKFTENRDNLMAMIPKYD